METVSAKDSANNLGGHFSHGYLRTTFHFSEDMLECEDLKLFFKEQILLSVPQGNSFLLEKSQFWNRKRSFPCSVGLMQLPLVFKADAVGVILEEEALKLSTNSCLPT